MAWVTPVTNRTGGYYTYEDLNRVGGNVQFLSDLLNGYGYAVSVSPKTDWTVGDIPQEADATAYLDDLTALKNAFYGATTLPDNMDGLTYIKANNIEKLLEEIEGYINRMIAAFQYCGVAICGNEVIL